MKHLTIIHAFLYELHNDLEFMTTKPTQIQKSYTCRFILEDDNLVIIFTPYFKVLREK